MQVVTVGQQLFLQGLAPHIQALALQAQLFELTAQQQGLLFGLGTALFRVAQLAVGFVHVQTRQAHFFVDAHAQLKQFFQLQAQLFLRCLAFFKVQAQLLLTLAQTRGLLLQTLQGLARGIVLGAQRAEAHGQLMGVVLVLAGLLANTVEAFAQGVAPGHQLFALLGVLGHQVQGFLKHQARLAQLFVLDRALFVELGQLFLQAAAPQFKLFGAGATG
ncbi:hypothetical protein D3C81_988880 [compost metagenome]